VLPSHNPSVDATALWGPVLGWCLVRVLADCVQVAHPDAAATGVFDDLRLRPAFAEIFAGLGFEGEDSWAASARVRLALTMAKQTSSVPAKAAIAAAPELAAGAVGDRWLWDDPDVKWLAQVHNSEGVLYFVHEPFEQLLWWSRLPELVELARKTVPEIARIQAIEAEIKARVAAAKRAGYKLEELLKPPAEAEQPVPHPADAIADDVAAGSTPDPVSYNAIGPDAAASVETEVSKTIP
jgi:hypothetical protein